MGDENKIYDVTDRTRDQIIGLFDNLFAVTKPGAVYSEPINAEGTTIITASEVMVGMGVGFGVGAGYGMSMDDDEGEAAEPPDDEVNVESGAGGGGGGGGGANGRPVAVISVNKYGVAVEPVVDVTKVALGFFAAFASMVIMLGSIRKAGRK